MLVLPYIFCIFYILFIKKTEKNTWLLSATFIAFLSITSATYADLENYIPLYEYVNHVDLFVAKQASGIGWVIINRLFYSFGFSYRGMIVLMLYVNYYLLHIAVRRFRANENMYFGMFLVFPSIIQLVQFKFFTAFCIIFLGYSLLLTSEKFPIIKYIFFVLIATLIHASSLFFLILIIIKIPYYNRKIFIFVTFILVASMLFFLDYIIGLSKFFLNPRLFVRYLTNSITPSSITWIIISFMVWLLSLVISLVLSSDKLFVLKIDGVNKINVNIVRNCIKAIILLLLIFPLLLLDRNYYRFLEFGYSLLYVTIGMYILPPRYSSKKIIFTFLCIIFFIIVTYVFCPYETVLKPIFSFEGFVSLRRY